jgi:hypothetical protein
LKPASRLLTRRSRLASRPGPRRAPCLAIDVPPQLPRRRRRLRQVEQTLLSGHTLQHARTAEQARVAQRPGPEPAGARGVAQSRSPMSGLRSVGSATSRLLLALDAAS